MKMKQIYRTLAILLMTKGLFAADPAWPEPTPVNQVFQYQSSGSYITSIGRETRNATCYLWIPETCKRVRGLLVLGANVPEHRLVGHELIRRMCSANDLGILWTTPSFLHPVDWTKPFPPEEQMKPEREAMVVFYQQQLEALAKASGYDEVATVPWLPIGESTHVFLVDALLESRPERCIAGIYVKNTRIPPNNRQTPVLCLHATAQEWDQEKTDIRSKWNDLSGFYNARLHERRQNPGWPRSLVIDGHSGHFDCSDRLTAYMARYIEQAVNARCSADGSPALKPVEITSGFVADLPVPGHGGTALAPAKADDPRPWFFDRTAALEAQQIATINWKAETQLPILLDEQGKAIPNDFRGITKLTSVPFEADGLTFQLRCGLADKIPAGFVNAGEKLARAPGSPTIEWLIGALEPRGGNRFRISLDRTWLGGGSVMSCLAIRQPGTEHIREVVQPVYIDLKALRNTNGIPQKIIFAPIGDVPTGTASVPLRATSDADLPVSFFVVSGPAVVREKTLVFTTIPPRSKWPVSVTVAAWQWGRRENPAVKTAEIVQQTFRLAAPAHPR